MTFLGHYNMITKGKLSNEGCMKQFTWTKCSLRLTPGIYNFWVLAVIAS